MIKFKIGRHVVSLPELIVATGCIAGVVGYILFPGPLNALSYVLWPGKERSPGVNMVNLSYSVSGTTKYPGTVYLNITVTNKDILAHDFAILAVVGNNADGIWYGPGYYRDNIPPSTDVQFAPDDWWSQAFITTGPLNPGESYQVTRKIELASDPRITDALVEVRDKLEPTYPLVFSVKPNVIRWGD